MDADTQRYHKAWRPGWIARVAMLALSATALTTGIVSAGLAPMSSSRSRYIAVDRHAPITRMTVLVSPNGRRVDWTASNNLIAFSKLKSSAYTEIYVMKPDGSDQRCLTCASKQIAHISNDQPAWHPSGKYLVFQSVDPNLTLPFFLSSAVRTQLTEGGTGFNNNLWLATADGSHFYRLTNIRSGEAILHPHFSRDGKRLFWTQREFQPQGPALWTLKVANFTFDDKGPHLRKVTNYRPKGIAPSFFESHGFTADGRSIIFSSNLGGTGAELCGCALNIWEIDLTTQKLTNLTNMTHTWNEHAQLSPSGKHIVWISSRGFTFQPSTQWRQQLHTELWMMNADGSHKRQITFFNKRGDPEYLNARVIVADSSWNPSGDQLIANLTIVHSDKSVTAQDVVMQFDRSQ